VLPVSAPQRWPDHHDDNGEAEKFRKVRLPDLTLAVHQRWADHHADNVWS
jgi:hypothetical protein